MSLREWDSHWSVSAIVRKPSAAAVLACYSQGTPNCLDSANRTPCPAVVAESSPPPMLPAVLPAQESEPQLFSIPPTAAHSPPRANFPKRQPPAARHCHATTKPQT